MPLSYHIPDQVRIMGKDFAICPVDNLRAVHDARGMNFNVEQRIDIDTTQPTEGQEETFLHEIVHALNYLMAIPLKEEHVQRLGAGLYQVLADNPISFHGAKEDV